MARLATSIARLPRTTIRTNPRARRVRERSLAIAREVVQAVAPEALDRLAAASRARAAEPTACGEVCDSFCCWGITVSRFGRCSSSSSMFTFALSCCTSRIGARLGDMPEFPA